MCVQSGKEEAWQRWWGAGQAENDEGKMRSQENWIKDFMLGIGVVTGDRMAELFTW